MPEVSLPVERPESSIQLWSNLADSLKHGGFGQAGPEYLKLAQIVTQVRRMQLVRSVGEPRPDDAEWAKLSSIAGVVLTLIEPLREASRLLAELPTQLDARALLAADTSRETTSTPDQSESARQLESATQADMGETITSEPPRSATRSRRTTAKAKPPAKRQEAARAGKATTTRRATREPTRRARAANA